MVITGGASQLAGVRELAGQWLDRHVRMGLPAHLPGLPELAQNGGFAVATGLLKYALKPDVHYELPQHKAREIERAGHGYMRKMGRWFIESL
jgi:cell division protein FtsA